MNSLKNDKLSILGSGREVGKSELLFDSDKRILLDCGIKVKDPETTVTGFPPIPKAVDCIIIAHAHLDHSAFFPAVVKKRDCAVYGTPPTCAISELLIKDAKKIEPNLPFDPADIKYAFKKFIAIPYGVEQDIGGIKFKFHNSGHIPGSSIVEVNSKGKKIVYTSDFKIEETRLMKGSEVTENVDTLIIETTYATRELPNRKDAEKKMLKDIQDTINKGGNVLMPAFAVGRTQEIALILYHYDIELPVFVDGMSTKASDIFLNYPKYVKNDILFREAIGRLRIVGKEKSKAMREPSIIIATAGMLEGGPAISYLLALDKEYKETGKQSKVIFTGYSVEGTNSWLLQNKGMIHLKKKKGKKIRPIDINLPNDLYHLSAHASREDILKFIEKSNPEKIICVHGDETEKFAAELKEKGYDAFGPKNGDVIEL